jgi:hypothetical protein
MAAAHTSGRRAVTPGVLTALAIAAAVVLVTWPR